MVFDLFSTVRVGDEMGLLHDDARSVWLTKSGGVDAESAFQSFGLG